MNDQRTILVVDREQDLGDVLRSALSDRRVCIVETRGASAALRLSRQRRPDVVVFDLESLSPPTDALAWSLCRELAQAGTHLVTLGNPRLARQLPSDEALSKPYHYGSLVHKIKALLDQAEARSADRGVAVCHSGTGSRGSL